MSMLTGPVISHPGVNLLRLRGDGCHVNRTRRDSALRQGVSAAQPEAVPPPAQQRLRHPPVSQLLRSTFARTPPNPQGTRLVQTPGLSGCFSKRIITEGNQTIAYPNIV